MRHNTIKDGTSDLCNQLFHMKYITTSHIHDMKTLANYAPISQVRY